MSERLEIDGSASLMPRAARSSTALTVTGLSPSCESIYRSGEHALIGISLGNGYFTKRRIDLLAEWAHCRFEHFHFVVMGEAFTWTLRARGYAPDEARVSARRRERLQLNRVRRALASAGVADVDAHILTFPDLQLSAGYTSSLSRVLNLAHDDADFRARVGDVAEVHILRNERRGSLTMSERVWFASRYLLAEIPLWIDAARVVGVGSSAFCYHESTPFVDALWRGEFTIVPAANQAYLVVEECRITESVTAAPPEELLVAP